MNGTDIEQGRSAAEQGDWERAFELLQRADDRHPLTGPDLALFADVAYAAGRLDVTIRTWERAYTEGCRAGDRLVAAGAATRVAMHLLFDTGLMAPVRGWARRAEALLDERTGAPVHAWLAVVRAYERLLSGDFDAAGDWARRAIDAGDAVDPSAAALGRLAEARILILKGEVREGLERLEHAGVATVSGELDPLTTGIVYCELVCALQSLAQYDLAEEWTRAMERWRHGHAVGSIHGRCRVHRAEILRLRGATKEAEREAIRACDELRPYLRRELGWPLTELGRIRLRIGDLDGAEQAFLQAHQLGWDPQPGLALLYLARGDVARAAASIRDALEHPAPIPSKELPPNSDLRRAPLLQAQVEIALAAGDLGRARTAADELAGIADAFGSNALVAGAVTAGALVQLAEGDTAAARDRLDLAVQLWSEVGAPYETAVARTGLARALRAEGNDQRSRLEWAAARAGFREAEAAHQDALDEGVAGDADQDPGTGRNDPAPRSDVFRFEGDHWRITFEGDTVRLRDLKGLRHLSRLLARPRCDIHVLDLVAMERHEHAEGRPPDADLAVSADLGSAGELLDRSARAAYRRRVSEIDEDIEEARALGDLDREAQADAERTFLVRELARATGLGGRARYAGVAADRARVTVTRAIRRAMSRIRQHSPALGDHLEHSIRTGSSCRYDPDPGLPVVWHT